MLFLYFSLSCLFMFNNIIKIGFEYSSKKVSKQESLQKYLKQFNETIFMEKQIVLLIIVVLIKPLTIRQAHYVALYSCFNKSLTFYDYKFILHFLGIKLKY